MANYLSRLFEEDPMAADIREGVCPILALGTGLPGPPGGQEDTGEPQASSAVPPPTAPRGPHQVAAE